MQNLKLIYALEDGTGIHALNGVSVKLHQGERLGVVGESGSGKSTVAKTILRLLPPNARLTEGEVFFKRRNLLALPESQMNELRWKEISLVTQSAMNALNPVARISDQMVETFLAHRRMDRATILEESGRLFEKVGLSRNRIFDFPHQFSGGMRQRVVIALAIALSPALIIADEPTTALDVIMQAQIIQLLKSLSDEKGISILLITHDISIVAEICHTVAVMYAGTLMEYGRIDKVFSTPCHPYTMGLKGAFPTIKDLAKRLVSIPGSPPRLTDSLTTCGFLERCPFAVGRCRDEVPSLQRIEEDHSVACFRAHEAEKFRETIVDRFRMETLRR